MNQSVNQVDSWKTSLIPNSNSVVANNGRVSTLGWFFEYIWDVFHWLSWANNEIRNQIHVFIQLSNVCTVADSGFFFRLLVVVVVPFIFRILVHYETFFTRAQGPVIVIAKEEI